MPIFEFKCDECGYEFELLMRISDAKIQCEKCGSTKVSKLLSTFGAGVGVQPGTACGVDAACGSSCQSGGGCPFSS